MKKRLLFSLLFVAAWTSLIAQQTADKPANVSKEIAKLVKKMPLEEQQRLYEQLKRVDFARIEKEKNVKAATTEAKIAVSEVKTAAAKPAVTITPATAPTTSSIVESTTVKSNAAENKAFTAPTPTVPTKEEYITKVESMPKTTIEWEEETYDFGKITEGDIVSHTYKFKNTGNNPLLITNIKVGCGCTTPSWTKEAVAPGQSGIVELKFNSAHKKGMQVKSVTMYMNTDPIVRTLNFKGEVNPKEVAPIATPPAGGR